MTTPASFAALANLRLRSHPRPKHLGQQGFSKRADAGTRTPDPFITRVGPKGREARRHAGFDAVRRAVPAAVPQDHPTSRLGSDHGTMYATCHSLSTALRGEIARSLICLLYTSPSPRDRQKSRMPSSA